MKRFYRKALIYLLAVAIVAPAWLANGMFSATRAEAALDPDLTLTAVPASATIIKSTLVAETVTGVAFSNSAVESAVIGLAPIEVTLKNSSNNASDLVRISPIGDTSGHIQLWAEDTTGNWYNINVTGWGPAEGFSALANTATTTKVYAISDELGSYSLIANLVSAIVPFPVVATTAGIITVVSPLTLTAVPASATIIKSTLVAETVTGVAFSNSAVESAVIGLAPIEVTLKNSSNNASDLVRISPIGDTSGHIQLWAEDTTGNWYNINVTGWGPAEGFSALANTATTTKVYAISDELGSYSLIANLVSAIVPFPVVATTAGIITVTETVVAPVVSPDFTVTAIGGKTFRVEWTGNGATSYIIKINGIPDPNGLVPYSSTEKYSRDITVAEYGIYEITLVARNGAIEATDSKKHSIELKKVVLTPVAKPAPVVEAPVPVATPLVTAVQAAPVEQKVEAAPSDENGKIKSEETSEETEKVNWTPWIVLFVLIILAGAATGGYFYWFSGEDEIKSVVREPKDAAKGPKAGTRGNTGTKPNKKAKRW